MPGPRPIRLFTLGPPQVREGGEPVELSPRLLALLAYLAVASPRRNTRRDTLLVTFWPDRDGSRGRNALNQTLHRLRRRLGPEAIESRGDEELCVSDRLTTDAGQFEDHLEAGRREAALAVYRGEFLEGFHLPGAPEFETWMDGVRARLRREARETAVRLATEYERAGRRAEAAGRLRQALRICPTDESVARRLIRLHLDDGRVNSALRTYHRLARRTRGALGRDPSEETQASLSESGVGPAVPRPPPHVASLPPAARRVAGQLTDRARELMDAGRSSNAAARELAAQATRVDPAYAPGQATYSRAVASWIQLFGGPWEETGAALDAARQALEHDPELPAAHFARAFSLEVGGRLEEAIRGYRTLLKLRPGHLEATAHLGRTLNFTGDFDRALRWTERVRRTRGPEPEVLHELGMIHYCLGQDEEGEEAYSRALERKPDFRWAQGSWNYFDVTKGRRRRARERADRMLEREPDGFIGLTAAGNLRVLEGEFEEAIRYYEHCYRLDPDSRHNGILRATRTVLGAAHMRAGDPSRGRELLAEAEHQGVRALEAGASFGGLYYDLASIYAVRGESERALDWLGRAYRAGWLQHEFLDEDSLMDPLRGEARLAEVRAAMKRSVREQRDRLR